VRIAILPLINPKKSFKVLTACIYFKKAGVVEVGYKELVIRSEYASGTGDRDIAGNIAGSKISHFKMMQYPVITSVGINCVQYTIAKIPSLRGSAIKFTIKVNQF